MNRTDRLLAIVLQLQSRRSARARDLAAHFETSVRTIYRDIEALCEAGVPVVATPGRGYSLVEGYFLPPLSFSADEAMTLLLGGDFVAQRFDPQYQAAARTASQKIEAVLPARQRAELADLRESVRVLMPDLRRAMSAPIAALLGELRRAVQARRAVRFRYHAREQRAGQEPLAERTADPYNLAHVDGVWYLVAHCHERGAIRRFRLDRIEALVVGDATFERPPGFEPLGGDGGERAVMVRVLFAAEAARWVREARHFYVEALTETADGLLATLRVRRAEDVLGWVLGWGRQARVLEPESLRRRVAEEALAVARHYATAPALLT